MNPKINTLLPIALAVSLPGLSFVSNTRIGLPDGQSLLGSWLITAVLLYSLWYLLWYAWDLKKGKNKRGFWVALLAFLVVLLGTISQIAFQNMENVKWLNLFRLVIAAILFLVIQYAIKAQENVANLLVEKEQIQTENYRAQLKVLRAKVDPHFLFNSLNTLRSMVRQQHANAEQFIMSLSQFYRQTLKHNDNTTLPLSEELAVLQSYLFLMKSRNEEAVMVSLDIDDSLQDYHLPALALQVVVENCFKHNSMTSKKPLRIEIGHTDESYIEVRNNRQPKIGDHDSSGLGLDLLRKRYDLMKIPQGLTVQENPDQFIVKLKLI
jgi:two-component system LytT family sensor kinase